MTVSGILLVFATGLWIALDPDWAHAYRLALAAHGLLAVLFVPAALRGLFRHLRRELPELAPLTAVAGMTLILCGFLLPHLPSGNIAPSLGAVLIVSVVVSGTVLWLGLRRWIARVVWRRATVLEIVHLLLWATCAATGPVLVVAALGGASAGASLTFLVHRVFGLAMVGIGTWALAERRLRARFSGATERAGAALGVVLAFAATIAGAAHGVAALRAPRPMTLHLSTVPLAERPVDERDPLPLAIDPALLAISRSCGGPAGCHPDVVSDHTRSSHARSMQPPHMRRSLELLASERGAQETPICFGCHDPGALARTDPSRIDLSADQGLACTACHAMRSARLAEGRHASVLTLALDPVRLEPFARAETSGAEVDRWTRLLIWLNPRAHGRALEPAILSSDGACLVCHGAQIHRSAPEPGCITCHMPPRGDLDHPSQAAAQIVVTEPARESTARSHRFLGSNVTLPVVLGDAESAALTARWLSSELLRDNVPNHDYGVDPERPELSDARRRGFFYVDAHVESEAPPVAGQAWRFHVRTRNELVNHGFPAGPMDLLEVWLELSVLDGTGREIFRSGFLDDSGRVPADAHRLGGHAVDAHGQPIDRYRVWDMDHEVIERAIALGESADDAFQVPIPANAGGFVSVRARWLYRELNPEFVEWAYGPEFASSTPLPAAEVARTFFQERVALSAARP